MKLKGDDPNSVGVIIGRFQVPKLHEGQVELFDGVLARHKRVIVFLGLSPLKGTFNNPLDFRPRKQMIEAKYKGIEVLYIKDVRSDKRWSETLDEQIKGLVAPTQKVVLYGGRDSFVDHYFGKYETKEFEPNSYFSGTEIRRATLSETTDSAAWRAGAINTTQTQYINAVPTVDVAIVRNGPQVLLGRKRLETEFRFPGGHVNPGETMEGCGARETKEETNLVVENLDYVGSYVVDDWRHRSEKTKITTVFFLTSDFSGTPEPGDDIHELRWFDFNESLIDKIVEEHHPLIQLLEPKIEPFLK